MSWALDPRLEASSILLAELELCQARLADDARWPWVVLIPRVEGASEIEDLAADERALLMEEVVLAGAAVRAAGAAAGLTVDKLNVGALGLVVGQLHVHVVGRRRQGDPAGEGPVWGWYTPEPYAPDLRERMAAAARAALR